jgi:copper chaperone CopZ
MKKSLVSALAAGLLSVAPLSAAVACPGHEEAKAPKAAQHLASATFAVTGIKDANAARLKTALLKTTGIAKVDVQVTARRVIVAFDKDKLTVEQVAKIITQLGYPAAAEV